jgi:hypothetical protein
MMNGCDCVKLEAMFYLEICLEGPWKIVGHLSIASVQPRFGTNLSVGFQNTSLCLYLVSHDFASAHEISAECRNGNLSITSQKQ